ncbi:hypothetical protein [Massilia endophytica]|uniref:hypothetical protein n=1 Tax=Massilia endophytica TaxID=2899220 RepID=UPI001E356672|nr:hypothetical protein [Massilia endophytica]UGQ44687.1 hypothetical protein LSQ66_12825 [Massilia endophytica]
MHKLSTRAALLACTAALAFPAAAAPPVRGDHPILGIWKFELPDGSCEETYRIRADGTTLITSAQEVAESHFTIDDQPDEEGFYKSQDKIVKDNGKLDCSGNVTEVGRSVTSYLLFHGSGNMFLMCQQRDTRACIGPFIRVRGTATI